MRFGFIGLGDMGSPMVRQILRRGHSVTVWNRSSNRAHELVSFGADIAASPSHVAQDCSIVGLCLTSHSAVEAVCFGSHGLVNALAERTAAQQQPMVVDFSTGSPDAAQRLAERARGRGVQWVDAPVSGGPPAAETGQLTVFAGGEALALNAASELLDSVATRVTHLGPSGAGQMVKLCNQMIVACNVLAVAESFALARKAGVDTQILAAALQGGFADSRPLQLFGPRMASQQFEPRLGAIGLMGKDVRLSHELAKRLGASTPLLNLADTLFERAAHGGDIRADGDISQAILLFEAALPELTRDAPIWPSGKGVQPS